VVFFKGDVFFHMVFLRLMCCSCACDAVVERECDFVVVGMVDVELVTFVIDLIKLWFLVFLCGVVLDKQMLSRTPDA
jgi:hypothetical protein